MWPIGKASVRKGGAMLERRRRFLVHKFWLRPLGLIVATGCLFAFFSAISSPGNQSTEPNDWENPLVFSRNAEPPHATLMPYASMEEALAGERLKSPYCALLNGKWKFHWTGKPADRPLHFYRPDFDVSAWKEIEVPGNWQLQGYDVPIYLNTGYPFKKDPPRIPHDHNPVGSYRTEFEIPEAWLSRQVFLHFDGVESAFYAWVNGELVGYSEDSRTPAEFNITRLVRPGKNCLAVEVYRSSCASMPMPWGIRWGISSITGR